MIPIGLASSLLGNVGSAISSGLAHLTGHSATSETGQPSFASHLKAATAASDPMSALQHHHMHAKTTAKASADASSGGSVGSSTGSVINTVA